MTTDPARLLNELAPWCAVALALVVTGRTLLGLACAALGRLPGAVGSSCRRAGDVVTPLVVRRLLSVALGAGASAVPVAASAVAVVEPADVAVLPELDRGDPVLPDLDRAASSRPAVRAAGVVAPVGVLVVQPGDTLWHIAARSLPAGATATRIDREWRRWYRANRSVIGADPDLILPGQRLVPPPA